MATKVSTFSLHLPNSLKPADGTSMNQLLVMAATEKLSTITTAEAFFVERKGRANRAKPAEYRP